MHMKICLMKACMPKRIRPNISVMISYMPAVLSPLRRCILLYTFLYHTSLPLQRDENKRPENAYTFACVLCYAPSPSLYKPASTHGETGGDRIITGSATSTPGVSCKLSLELVLVLIGSVSSTSDGCNAPSLICYISNG